MGAETIFPPRTATTGLYPGVISGCDYERKTYTVDLDGPYGRSIGGCVWAVGPICGLIGIKTNHMPLPGTRVMVWAGPTNYIIATLPSDPPDRVGGKIQSITGQLDFLATLGLPSAGTSQAAQPFPSDLLPGELDLGFQTGSSLQLLYHLSRLKAGERAAVECHLLEEMVRVISEEYQHFSALGKLTIANTGGGPSLVWQATSKTHERLGNLDPGDPEAKVSNGRIDADSVAETLRARFVAYMGYLGDFLNLLICDPDDTVAGYLSQANSGKQRIHLGTDGTVLVQSVAEIAFERVVRIPVPVQLKDLKDPTGDTRQDIENAVKQGGARLDDLLKRWEWGKSNERMHLLPYQLREYSRYLSQLHSWARLLAQENDFRLPSEAECDAPSWNNRELDVERANQDVDSSDFFEVYATIRIFRNGAVMLQDGAGSSVLLSDGDVRIAATRDVEIEAGRDIRMVAGRNFFGNVRRNIELNAITGHLATKSRLSWKALCEWGGIWLKSDAADPRDPEFDANSFDLSDQPDPEFDQAPAYPEFGIFLDAPLGSMMLQSGRRLVLESTGSAVRDAEKADAANTEGSVLIRSAAQDVMIKGMRNGLWAVGAEGDDTTEGNLRIETSGLTVQARDRVYVDATHSIALGTHLVVRPEQIHATTLTARSLAASSGIFGPPVKGETEPGGKAPPTHFNHIRKLADFNASQSPDMLDAGENERKTNSKKVRMPGRMFRQALPTWNYFKPEEYIPGSSVDAEAVMPFRSPSQERLALDTNLHAIYGEWTWSSDNALNSADARTGDKRPDPWYGATPKWLKSDSAEEMLHVPSSNSGEAFAAPADVVDGARIMRYWRKLP